VAPSSDKDSFSSTRPLRPHQHPHPHQHPSHPAATAAAGGDERRRRRSSDSTTTSSNNKPFVFSLIPPSPHNHLILVGTFLSNPRETWAQVIYTYEFLSPSSIIWYWPKAVMPHNCDGTLLKDRYSLLFHSISYLSVIVITVDLLMLFTRRRLQFTMPLSMFSSA